PDLSKPISFDYMRNRLDGAWRSITLLLLMPIHLSPEGLSVLGIYAVKCWQFYGPGFSNNMFPGHGRMHRREMI
ncbi:MAG: hypothetical protein KKH41_09445, partial [Candidatus Thermoplasmatota archaeon]|nr:hypothetical protein [Candidatus Thermoplasmatota archaeon]MBU4143657.1 hypothetical protein [Candidatus Thermoplasmatota archaeon]MBU4592790.1 hypothetical protein [Candidatus Thermoplasmatota archaeon]